MNFLFSVARGVVVTVLVLLLLMMLLAWAWPSPEETQSAVHDIHSQTAADFERQYYQVQKTGSMVDRCVRAGLVAEGYLQAADNVKFSEWVAIKNADCAAAGINF